MSTQENKNSPYQPELFDSMAAGANIEQTANTANMQPEYHLPQWFIAENMKTHLQLSELLIRKEQTSEYSNTKGLEQYLMSSASYQELQDVVGATLVPSGRGMLPHREFSVLLRSDTFTEEFLDSAMMNLAKDMGANLICLDIEDLEALTAGFAPQELSSAFSAILDGCTAQAKSSASNGGGSDVSNGGQQNDIYSKSGAPSIIHLRQVNRVTETPYGHTFLKTIRDIVQMRRTSGDATVVVVSAAGSAGSSQWWENEDAEEILCLSRSSTAYLEFPETWGNADTYLAEINIRRLKTLLRHRISHVCDQGLLDLPSSWARDDYCGGGIWPMGEKPWTIVQLQKAATQITGRAFKKSHLDLTDIRDVLIRNRLCNEHARDEDRYGTRDINWGEAPNRECPPIFAEPAPYGDSQCYEELPNSEELPDFGEFPAARGLPYNRDSQSSEETESDNVSISNGTEPDELDKPEIPNDWLSTPSTGEDSDGSQEPNGNSATGPNAGDSAEAENWNAAPITRSEAKNSDEGKNDPNAWIVAPSKAKQEWEAQKMTRGEENEDLDHLMDLIGLESVKANCMELKTFVETSDRQDVDLKGELFGTVFLGNPGVGKTKVAEIYARLLSNLQLVSARTFKATTGAALLNGGIKECKKFIKSADLERYAGAVLLIDDAHQMVSGTSSSVLSYIVSQMDLLQGEVVFVFAGYPKPMEALFASCPGLQSRISRTIKFDSYDDNELHQILVHKVSEKFDGRMRVEGGINGVYTRIVARRIGRGRGKSSFGNAREVYNTLNQILFRQAKRLEESRSLGQEPDDFFLTKIDLIGPPPSTNLEHSKAWQSLKQMIGLSSVKRAVQALIDRLQVNYNREILEQPLVDCSLNKVFLGNPGTGKTTVAKYYGQILADIGLLSDGEVVIRSPSDFIGSALGQTESLTKAILESTKGKVLIIDEAYALSDETTASGSGNFYKTAVVDTLVAEIQSTAADDRCVLLLGYEERMAAMFQHVNPALSRRFPMSSAFKFEDYTDKELRQILDLKLATQGFTATEQAKQTALECLMRTRNQKNFGNAGEVDILLDRAKESQQMWLSSRAIGSLQLEAQDFDVDFERFDRAESNIEALFSEFVGAEALVETLKGYQQMAQNCKAVGMDPQDHIPFSFLFRGPPGSGKTTTAKLMGNVFYDMGLVATPEVVNCSASDLIGEFVGQTGPKVINLFQKALGKVLFIDEAYRLADNVFGKVAVEEMMNILTQDQYKGKLITILAGYEEDMNRLLAINPGFDSRFPEAMDFPHLSPGHCCTLLMQCLRKQKLDTSMIESDSINAGLSSAFQILAELPAWGNARDVQSLSKAVFGRIMRAHSPVLLVTAEALLSEVSRMVIEKQKRAAASVTQGQGLGRKFHSHDLPSREQHIVPVASVPAFSVETIVKHEDPTDEEAAAEVRDPMDDFENDFRNEGVSDEIWKNLKKAKLDARLLSENLGEQRARVGALKTRMRTLEEGLGRGGMDATEARNGRRELARLEEDLEKQGKFLEKLEHEAALDTAIKERLGRIGFCEFGCPWVSTMGGYRCSAGACFMPQHDVDEMMR